jgi:hypothetical protein
LRIRPFIYIIIFSYSLSEAKAQERVFKKDTSEHSILKVASKLHPTILPAIGYSLQTNWAAAVNYNLGFYNGVAQDSDQKISSINTSITYTLNKQIILPFQANVWSKNKKYNFITDLRYLQYPSLTYGLGARSSIDNGYTLDYNYIKLHQTIARAISNHLYAGIGFFYDAYWNIEELDKPTTGTTSFERYGFNPKEKAVGLAFKLLYDSRLNQITPSNGWYGNILYRPNYTGLGSDNNWESILIEARKYFQFPNHSNNILAFWTYNWLTLSGKPPYLFLPSTAWDDNYNTGRGYIQGRYRGRNMMYLESEYRFNVSKNKRWGGVIFANAQSFSKDIKSELSVIAPGYGAGIRFKINPHTNTNVCIDYAFGSDGSKGIFVNLGEVF